MKRRRIIAIVVLAVLALLAVGIFRGMATRELILRKNGVPLANLKANINVGIKSSTDVNGRLDLSAVRAGTQCIFISLRDDAGPVFNGGLSLPTRGSRTIDFRGNRTISTTTTTYVDFGFYKFTGQEIEDWVEFKTAAAPAKAEPEQPPADAPAQPPASR